jgi:hypothetical protein
MEGYRLRSSHGDTVDPRQPFPVDTVEAQETVSETSTITYNGKAAAGAITINALPFKPIISVAGDQVASYWGLEENKVYTAFSETSPKRGSSFVRAVVETATAATVTIFDPDKNLEEMFESVTGTVKRFVLKVTDKSGGSLYGWVMGVAVTANLYTLDIYNARLAETQSWVGTLTSFDNTAIEKVEIFHYNSSLVFNTGTILIEEVDCPKEYSKSWEQVMRYAETLANGQYFVDYMRGRIVGVKAATTATETATYNVWSSTSSGAGAGGTSFTTSPSAPTVLTGGTKAVTTSGTALALGTTLATKSIYIRAKLANTGNVYVGDSAVDATTSQQIVLAAGDSVTIDIADRATVYVDAAVNGEGVDYLAMS